MSEAFLGEIRWVSSNYAPKGWALCNGQLLPLAQYQALFSLLGNAYGGDGMRTFALPNLMSRVPVHADPSTRVGTSGGEAAHTLTQQEMPAHQHTLGAVGTAATSTSPVGNALALDPAGTAYAPAPDGASLSPQALGATGSGSAHPNLPPYLVLNAIIALQGVFPSRG